TAAMFTVMLVRSIALNRLEHAANATDNQIDDFLVEVLRSTRIFLALGVAIYVAVHLLVLPQSVKELADRAFIGLLILQSGFWASRGLDFFLRQRLATDEVSSRAARATTRPILAFIGRVVLWALIGLLLDNMGLNVTALVASMGIGGIAVALAVQNILGDLFASLSIAIDQPFVVGDFVIVDDLMGTIEHVGLKTTRVRSLGGEQIIFSNNDLLKSRIRNYKRMQERRVVFSVRVTYDTPHDRLEKIPGMIAEAIGSQDSTRFDRAHLKGFGPSSLDYEAVYYVLDPDFNLYMDIQQAINLSLVRSFRESGVEFAFPTQTLHLATEVPSLLQKTVPSVG
ncbi:MAG: mechanosensitive ion channel family protein, partial [Burkholderiaceae bacterium]|nr:mechanosensitive ion channel family protein [Burkholderiaceae bacterium]